MTQKLSITDLPITGHRVLMRVDFNVPLDKERHITDATRIAASLPSIQHVLDHGGSVIAMSHLGRPKGADPQLSLRPCADKLAELLGRPVQMAPDAIGPQVEAMAAALQPGQVMLLENLRFHKGEEKPDADPNFAPALARLGDLYVNDAFGTAHRAHASTATIAQHFPGKAAAGFLLQKEIQFLGEALLNPKRPFVAVLGGAKVSSKIGVIEALLKKVDTLLIGGGMAYTFFKARGLDIGNSLFEADMLPKAREILASIQHDPQRLLLPVDHLVADAFDNSAKTQLLPTTQNVPPGWLGVDIGPKTVEAFSRVLRIASTAFWNGPLGVFEIPAFAQGTTAVAHVFAQLPATTIVGGGDSVAAIQQYHLADKITHISTGGGASLEYIEYGTLPGIEALSPKAV